MKQFGLSCAERIKSKKEFNSVYSSGEILFSPNQRLKAVFRIDRETDQAVIQAAFAVSRKAGTAVWRNRTRRLMRESFRLNKHLLISVIEEQKVIIRVVFSPNFINEKNNKKIFLKDIMPHVLDLIHKLRAKL